MSHYPMEFFTPDQGNFSPIPQPTQQGMSLTKKIVIGVVIVVVILIVLGVLDCMVFGKVITFCKKGNGKGGVCDDWIARIWKGNA